MQQTGGGKGNGSVGQAPGTASPILRGLLRERGAEQTPSGSQKGCFDLWPAPPPVHPPSGLSMLYTPPSSINSELLLAGLRGLFLISRPLRCVWGGLERGGGCMGQLAARCGWTGLGCGGRAGAGSSWGYSGLQDHSFLWGGGLTRHTQGLLLAMAQGSLLVGLGDPPASRESPGIEALLTLCAPPLHDPFPG